VFDPKEYDLVFSIDPQFNFPGSRQLAPVINIHESLIQPPHLIRDVLQIPDDKKLALIAHNGQEGEIEKLMKNSHVNPDEYCQKSLSSYTEESETLFPLAHYMKGVDLAIGGSGYSFFWETKFYNIPTMYIPQPRIGNEQHWRLEHCLDYNGPYDGADQMVRRIMDLF
jgi:hypothetical protein